MKKSKRDRILTMYAMLMNGETLKKSDTAQRFDVDERTIQRDIDDIRAYFSDNDYGKQVVYDRRADGYRISESGGGLLTNGEVLAVCKILLESRALVKDEMFPIMDKLIDCCVPANAKKDVWELVKNEKHHYIEPRHGVRLEERLLSLGDAIREKRIVEVSYTRLNGETVCRRLKPVGIMVSEFYFYLCAFIDNIDKKEHFENPDDLYPTIYHIDRIEKIATTDERFYVPYADRFEEGEFRKRVQFMFGGRLQTVTFRYTGPSIEAVLDRLPTAKIVEEDENGWTVRAEVFGKGIEMWMRSQGDFVEIVDSKRENLYFLSKPQKG